MISSIIPRKLNDVYTLIMFGKLLELRVLSHEWSGHCPVQIEDENGNEYSLEFATKDFATSDVKIIDGHLVDILRLHILKRIEK